MIWNFNHTLTNTLGGRYNSFSKEPSWARTYLDPDIHVSNSRHALRITAHREWDGFCGVWFNIYPADSQPYFDARPYPYLSFWIRGKKPGGDFDIKIVDARGEENEDALATRPVHDYLSSGITTDWQKVNIPLADFPEIDPGSLARFVLIFSAPGDYQFYLGDISFESTPAAPTAVPLAGVAAPPKLNETNPYRSMWVWNSRTLLDSMKAADQFFGFCSRTALKEIYLSVDFVSSSGGISESIENAAAYGDFLSAAHQHGLRVEALAGAPSWAAGRNHARALAAVQAILSYNAAQTPDALFDGIHFDVEPYLLLGFSVPNYRKQLLEEYLEMVAECAAAARKGNLNFTCDIPWWFYPLTAAANEQFTVNFRGTSKTVGEHVTDLLNSVTIMDYRNEADGAGGIIRFGIPALAYAATVHKQVRVGLETSAQKDAPVEFVIAIPEKDFLARLRKTYLAGSSTFEHYSVHALRANSMVFVGLGPHHSETNPQESLTAALVRLRDFFGAKDSDQFSLKGLIEQARAAVAEDPSWTDFRPEQIGMPGSKDTIAAFRAIRRTPPVTTFYGLSRTVFEEESHSAAEWFGHYPSFGGLAVHYYQSFQALMEKP